MAYFISDPRLHIFNMVSSNIPRRSDRCVKQSVQVLDNISNLRHEKTTKTTTSKFGSNLPLLLQRLNG